MNLFSVKGMISFMGFGISGITELVPNPLLE